MTLLNLCFENYSNSSPIPTKIFLSSEAAQEPPEAQIAPPEIPVKSLHPQEDCVSVYDFASHVKDYGLATDYIANQLLGERVDHNLLTRWIGFQKNHPLFLLEYSLFISEKLKTFLEKNFSGAYFAYPVVLFAYELAIEAYLKQFYDFELDFQSRQVSRLLYQSTPFSKHPLVLLQENGDFATEFLVLPWALSGLVHLGVNAQPEIMGYPFASLDSNNQYSSLQLEMGVENHHCYLPITIQLKSWLESLTLFENCFSEPEEWDTLLDQLLIYLPKNSRSGPNIFAENPFHWTRFTEGLSKDFLFHQLETLLFSTQLYSNVTASILLFCGFCSGKKDFLLPLVLHGLPKLLSSETFEIRQLAGFLCGYLMPNTWAGHLDEEKNPDFATLHILNSILEEWQPEQCQFLIKGFGSLLPIFLDTQDSTLLIKLSQKMASIFPGSILTRMFLVLECCSSQMMAHRLLKESWRVLKACQSLAKTDPEAYASYVHSFFGHLHQNSAKNAGCIPIYVPADELRKLLQEYAPECVKNDSNLFSSRFNDFLSREADLKEPMEIAKIAEDLSKKEYLSKKEIFQLFQLYNRTSKSLTGLRKTLALLILNWLSDKELKIKPEQLHYIFLKTLPACFNKKSPLSIEEAHLFLKIFNRIPLRVRKQSLELKQLFKAHFEEIYKQLLHQPDPLCQCLLLAAQLGITPILQSSEEEAIVTTLLNTEGKLGFSESVQTLTQLRAHLSHDNRIKAAISILKAPTHQSKHFFSTWLLNLSLKTVVDIDSLIVIWSNCEKNKINTSRAALIRLKMAKVLLRAGRKVVTAAQLSALLIATSSQHSLSLNTIRKFMHLAHQNQILDQSLKETFLKLIYRKFNDESSDTILEILTQSEELKDYKLSRLWQKNLCLPLLINRLYNEKNSDLSMLLSLAEKIRSGEFSTQEKEYWVAGLGRLSLLIPDSESTLVERFCFLKPRCPASAKLLQTRNLNLIEMSLKTEAWERACTYIHHFQKIYHLEEAVEKLFNHHTETALSKFFSELSTQKVLELTAPLLEQAALRCPNRIAWAERWLTRLGENPRKYFSPSVKPIFLHYVAAITKFTREHVCLLQKLLPLLLSELASEFLSLWPQLSSDLSETPEDLIAFLSYHGILSEDANWTQDSAATICHLALVALGKQKDIRDFGLLTNRLMRLFASVSFQKAFSASGRIDLLSQLLHDHPNTPQAILLFQVLARGVLPSLKEMPLNQEQIQALQKMSLTLKAKTNHECTWHVLRLLKGHLNAEQVHHWHKDISKLFSAANDTIKGMVLSQTSAWDDFSEEIYHQMAAADPLTTSDIFENRIPNKRLLRLCRSRYRALSADIWFAILTRIATSNFTLDEIKELYGLWNRTAHAKISLDDLLSNYCLRGLVLFFTVFQAEDKKQIERFTTPERLIVIQKHLFTINEQLTKEKQNYRDYYCNLFIRYAGLCREKGSEPLIKMGLVLLSGSILLFQGSPLDTSKNVYSTLTPTLKQLLTEVIGQLSKWKFQWANFDTRFLVLSFLLDTLEIVSFGNKSEKSDYMENFFRKKENRIMVLCWAVSSLHDTVKIPVDKAYRIEVSKANVKRICQLILIKSLEWGDEKELAQICSNLNLLTEQGKVKGLNLAKHLGNALANLSTYEIQDYNFNRNIVTKATLQAWLTPTALDLLWQNVFVSGYTNFRMFPTKLDPTEEILKPFLIRVGMRDQHLLSILAHIQSYFSQRENEYIHSAILHVIKKNHSGLIQKLKSVLLNTTCTFSEIGRVIWEEGHCYIKEGTLQLLHHSREQLRRLNAVFTDKKRLFTFVSELHYGLYYLINDPTLFLAQVKETIEAIREQKYPSLRELRNDGWSSYTCIIYLGGDIIKLLLSHERSKGSLDPKYFECLFYLLQKQFKALLAERILMDEVFSAYTVFQDLLKKYQVAESERYLNELEACSRKIKLPKSNS